MIKIDKTNLKGGDIIEKTWHIKEGDMSGKFAIQGGVTYQGNLGAHI